MNPLTKIKLINELNEREANLGINESVSWHTEYKDSAWVFVGGFPYELTEGDLICVFSQYGEIVNINLVRDKKTGKSKGFCFICYEDQRSTILAVDNFNGIKIKGRTIRVDHVKNYRPPKDNEDIDDVTKRLRDEGCAPSAAPPSSSEEEEQNPVPTKKVKKDKKEKKKKKKEKKKKKSRSSSRSPPSSPRCPPAAVRVKEEKPDTAYDKYNQQGASAGQKGSETERWRGTDREEDRRRNRGTEDNRRGEVDRHREVERDRRREMDREDDRKKEDRWREAEREDRRRETNREDRRKERDTDRRREMDRR